MSKCRRADGASLILVIAIFGTFGLSLLLFALHYIQELGNFQEQRTAIEAASLAAARDLSLIVVEDPNVGFISLSDSAPVGTNTAAGDGFPTSVHGINSLLATARLDMIIADYMQDPIMQALAQKDYNNAIAAQQRLTDQLNQIFNNNGTGTDRNGKTVNPLQDATNEYIRNSIRMSGGNASLVAGSLKLKLGFVQNSQSSLAFLPKPVGAAAVPVTQQSGGFYLPNVSISYKNQYPMTFAALGADATLVDIKLFQSALSPPAALATPTVVFASAQEHFTGDATSESYARDIIVSSAAEAGSIIDQLPNPGLFTLTFLNGPLQEITCLGDIFDESQLATDPTDLLQTPLNGDYPQTNLSLMTMPTMPGANKGHPQLTYLISLAFYDWIRRAGTNVNISQLMNTLNQPLAYSGNGPQIHNFQVKPDGTISYTVTTAPLTNLCCSQNQWRAFCGLGLNSASKSDPNNYKYYDVELTDFCYQPGRTQGGKHAGEPLTNPGELDANPSGQPGPYSTVSEDTTWMYQCFTNGGSSQVRPTYQNAGIAADITFRLRP